MGKLAIADRFALAAGGLAAVAAAAGLFLPGIYRDAPFWAQQARGTDIATFFLAVPILFVGLWSARRGSDIGRLLVTGGTLYLVYNYAIYAFAVAMNPLLAVYIATLAFAGWSIALMLASGALPRSILSGLPRRVTAGVLIAVAIVFGLLWLSQIAAATFTGQIPVDLQRAELPTNPVYALDLAFFLPLCIVAAIGLLRKAPAAAAFALPMLMWLFVTSVGIVGAFVFATLSGDEFPVAAGALVAAIGILTGAFTVLGATAGTARSTSSEAPARLDVSTAS